jgi:hypothetical protein
MFKAVDEGGIFHDFLDKYFTNEEADTFYKIQRRNPEFDDKNIEHLGSRWGSSASN